jgi:hypothetical protein
MNTIEDEFLQTNLFEYKHPLLNPIGDVFDEDD